MPTYEQVQESELPPALVNGCRRELERMCRSIETTGQVSGSRPTIEFARKARGGFGRPTQTFAADLYGWTEADGKTIVVVADDLPVGGGPAVVRHELAHSLEKATGAVPDLQSATHSDGFCSTLAQAWGERAPNDIDVKRAVDGCRRQGLEMKRRTAALIGQANRIVDPAQQERAEQWRLMMAFKRQNGIRGFKKLSRVLGTPITFSLADGGGLEYKQRGGDPDQGQRCRCDGCVSGRRSATAMR
jgi:hypothetical protein